MKNCFSKNEVIAILQKNNCEKPKAKYSNDILLTMLKHTDLQHIESEPTRNGFELNRGVVCECIIKAKLRGFDNAYKTSRNADLKKSKGDDRAIMREYELEPNLNYEIKFTSSFALASDSILKTKYVILVLASGVYLVPSKEYKRANYPQGKRLDKLSQELGL
jgi:hypothetical protein